MSIKVFEYYYTLGSFIASKLDSSKDIINKIEIFYIFLGWYTQTLINNNKYTSLTEEILTDDIKIFNLIQNLRNDS